jgi:putative membrane protein
MKTHAITFAMLFASAAALASDTSPASSETTAIAHLMALNDHEIKAAEIAEGKHVSAPVADYAATMKKEHGENQAKTVALPSAPAKDAADAPEVAAQKQKAEAERRSLAAKSGEEFEAAYIDAMVKGHAEALSMLDTKLIPAAKNDGVRAHFRRTREHVAMHLEKARALKSK